MNIGELRAQYPFPWPEVTNPNGLMQVLDANGADVPLFTQVAFVVALTAHLAGK